MNLSPNLRNGLYAALVILNTVLAVCASQNAIPGAYAHYTALASLVLAALMKEFAMPAKPKDPADSATPDAGAP